MFRYGTGRGGGALLVPLSIVFVVVLLCALLVKPAIAGFFDYWGGGYRPPYSGGYYQPDAFGRRRR